MSQSLVSRMTGELVPVRDVVGLLTASYLDVLHQRLLVMREEFQCPPRVLDGPSFRAWLGRFYLHYERSFHGVEKTIATAAEEAFVFVRQHYRGDLAVAERNSILGRDGSFIAVVDQITESLIKTQTEAYLDRVLWEFLPHDHYARLAVAEELLGMYGRAFCPEDELLPSYVLAANLEQVMKNFAQRLRPMRAEWRS